MTFTQFAGRFFLPIFMTASGLIGNIPHSVAQAKCSTTLECAQQAVDAAARVDAAFQTLQSRIAKLEALEKSLGNSRILAIAEVKGGKIHSGSAGVAFDQKSGVFSFPNPKGLKFVPVVSDSREQDWISQTHWIKGMLPPDKIIVRAKALDTGGADRTYPAHDFTVVVIGLDGSATP